MLTFTLEEEGERPVSGKGGKAPKGGGKGGKEVEKVEKSKLISYGEAAIIEGKEFVYFDDKGVDIGPFIEYNQGLKNMNDTEINNLS